VKKKTQNEVVILKDDFTARETKTVTLSDDFVFFFKKKINCYLGGRLHLQSHPPLTT